MRADAATHGYTFGLLIPELGRTEIFEPICRGMAEAQHSSRHVLLWGSSLGDAANVEEQASQACRQLVAKNVSGVFFAPLELTPEKDAINRRIADVFEQAGIPVVLLDRDLVAYPDRSQYDLVGIDNRRAGYVHYRTPLAARLPPDGVPGTSTLRSDRGRPHQRLQGGDEPRQPRGVRVPQRARRRRRSAAPEAASGRLRLRQRFHRGPASSRRWTASAWPCHRECAWWAWTT